MSPCSAPRHLPGTQLRAAPGLLSLSRGAQAPLPPPGRPRAHLPPGALATTAAAAAAASPGFRQPPWPFCVSRALAGPREQHLRAVTPSVKAGSWRDQPHLLSPCSSFQGHRAPATCSIPPKHPHLAGRLGWVHPSREPAPHPPSPQLLLTCPAASPPPPQQHQPPHLAFTGSCLETSLRSTPSPTPTAPPCPPPGPYLPSGPDRLASPHRGAGEHRVPFALRRRAKEGRGHGAGSCA